MDKSSKVRVLIIDDHPIVRNGLRQIEDIDANLKVIGEAANGEEAISQVQQLKPHVVLLDYRLPDLPGHEVCRRLKTLSPSLRVLFLSSYGDEATASAALDAGADGYLLKQNDAQKIVDAIKTVCAGGLVIDPSVARATVSRMREPVTVQPSILDRLSDQERKVLTELAKGKTDKEIAEVLQLQSKTVRNYLAGIYKKLQVHTRTQAALLFERASSRNTAEK